MATAVEKITHWEVVGRRPSVDWKTLLVTTDREHAQRSLTWHREKALALTEYAMREYVPPEPTP